MSTPDMEVIKEIPGYKVILKAVLKTQIQQLVEQLASHTDEESVILTASVADGTLSHLGSDSGKYFLDDHEDVKSQFLGFCLRRHHQQKQAIKEKEHIHSTPPIPTYYGPAPGPRMNFVARNSWMQFPRQSTPRNPMIGVRHEPYPMYRPLRRESTDSTNLDSNQVKLPEVNSPNTSKVKLEPDESSNKNLITNNVSPITPSPSQIPSESKDDEVSDSLPSVVPNDISDGNLNDSLQKKTEGSDSNVDSEVSVKIEAVTEAEMELEITGVELGRPVVPPQENWGPKDSAGLHFDPSGTITFDPSNAPGNQTDMQQGYNTCTSIDGIKEDNHVNQELENVTTNLKGISDSADIKADIKDFPDQNNITNSLNTTNQLTLDSENSKSTESKLSNTFVSCDFMLCEQKIHPVHESCFKDTENKEKVKAKYKSITKGISRSNVGYKNDDAVGSENINAEIAKACDDIIQAITRSIEVIETVKYDKHSVTSVGSEHSHIDSLLSKCSAAEKEDTNGKPLSIGMVKHFSSYLNEQDGEHDMDETDGNLSLDQSHDNGGNSTEAENSMDETDHIEIDKAFEVYAMWNKDEKNSDDTRNEILYDLISQVEQSLAASGHTRSLEGDQDDHLENASDDKKIITVENDNKKQIGSMQHIYENTDCKAENCESTCTTKMERVQMDELICAIVNTDRVTGNQSADNLPVSNARSEHENVELDTGNKTILHSSLTPKLAFSGNLEALPKLEVMELKNADTEATSKTECVQISCIPTSTAGSITTVSEETFKEIMTTSISKNDQESSKNLVIIDVDVPVVENMPEKHSNSGTPIHLQPITSTKKCEGPTKAKQVESYQQSPTTPNSSKKHQRKQATTPGKQNFIDSLISTGIPIIIPDDDVSKMPKARSPAYKAKSRQYRVMTPMHSVLKQNVKVGQKNVMPVIADKNVQLFDQVYHTLTQPHHLFTPPKNSPYLQWTATSPSIGSHAALSRQSSEMRMSPLSSPTHLTNPLSPAAINAQAFIQSSITQQILHQQATVPALNKKLSGSPISTGIMPSLHTPSISSGIKQQSPFRSSQMSLTNSFSPPHTPSKTSSNLGILQKHSQFGASSPKVRQCVQLTRPLQKIAESTIVIDDDVPLKSTRASPLVQSYSAAIVSTPVQKLPIITNVTSMAYGNDQNEVTTSGIAQQELCINTPKKRENRPVAITLDIRQSNECTPVKRTWSDDEVSTSAYTSQPLAKRRNTIDGFTLDSGVLDIGFRIQTPESSNQLDMSQGQLSPSKITPKVEIDVDDVPAVLPEVAKSESVLSNSGVSHGETRISDGRLSSIVTSSHLSTSDIPPFSPPISPSTRRLHAANIAKSKRKAKLVSTSEKNKCKDCGELFPNRAALKTHVKTHTTEQPFSCDVCGKLFKTKGNLKKHIYTHFEEKE